MGVVSKIKSVFTKKRKEETVTTTEIPAETRPSVTFVDVGREAPAGKQFVDSEGKPQGTFVRTGGYTIVGGRSAGGGGGSPQNIYDTSGEVTPQMAYELEGGKTITVQSSAQTRTIPNNAVLQKAADDKRQFNKGTIENFGVRKTQQQPIYTDPYITRKDPRVTGYTRSGKPIYEKGEAVVINPKAQQFGVTERIQRKPTPEELGQLETLEKEQGLYDFNTLKGKEALGSFFGTEKVFYDFIGEKATEKILPNVKPQPAYLPEDIYSKGELIKTGQYPALIRSYRSDVGKFVTSAWKVPYEKLTGKQVSPAISALSRGIIGETALYVGFAPAFTTTTQYYKAVAEPTKVTFAGTSQKGNSGTVITDVAFTAQKGGTVYRGIATGQAKTIPFKVGEKEFFKIFGQGRGVTTQRALQVPRGLVNVKPQVFVTKEAGIGFVKDRLFVSVTKGAIGIQPTAKAGYSFKFLSGGIQATGKTGITVIKGGTVSGYGGAIYRGILFPVKRSVIKFIPFASKKGQVLINPKRIIKFDPFESPIPSLFKTPPSLSITKQASAAVTKSSVQAFATTITPTYAISKLTPAFSLTSLPKERVSDVGKSSLMFKSSQIGGTIYRLRNIAVTKGVLDTPQRTSTSQLTLQITQVKQKQENLQVVKQVQKYQLINKFVTTRPQFQPPRLTPKRLLIPRLPSGKSSMNVGSGIFKVSVRRFGKFKTIGLTTTPKAAFRLGKFRTGTTLAATFKVEGLNKQPSSIAGYKTKRTKKGLLFIELPKYRLSTPTEKSEILSFRKLKGGGLF